MMTWKNTRNAIALLAWLAIAWPQTVCGQLGREDVSATFSKRELGRNELEPFELRAEQKASDLVAYLNLLADPEIDAALKEEVRKQIAAMFNTVNPILPDGTALLEWGEDREPLEIRRIRRSAAKAAGQGYVGKVRLQLQTPAGDEEWVLSYVIHKVNKQFGAAERTVWETSFHEFETD